MPIAVPGLKSLGRFPHAAEGRRLRTFVNPCRASVSNTGNVAEDGSLYSGSRLKTVAFTKSVRGKNVPAPVCSSARTSLRGPSRSRHGGGVCLRSTLFKMASLAKLRHGSRGPGLVARRRRVTLCRCQR